MAFKSYLPRESTILFKVASNVLGKGITDKASHTAGKKKNTAQKKLINAD